MNSEKAHYINMDEYFQSSVLISFIIQDDEYYLVLEKRSAHISQAGEICFPGGKFDKNLDTTTKDTAIRETCEELGVKKSQIKKVNYWGTYIAPMFTLIDVYIGLLDIHNVYDLPINQSEVEKLIVFPFSYFLITEPLVYKIHNWSHPDTFPAKDLGLPSKYHKPWKGKSRPVFVYPTDDTPIWGVTASIIKNLVNENISLQQIFKEVSNE